MADIWWMIGALIVGVLVGAVGFWIASRNGGAPGSSVRKLKQENEKFREEVNDHFVQTAELINRLTDSYKAVFDHLSDGAGRLVEDKVIRERMPQVSGQEIRLKPIGAPRADSPVQSPKSGASEKSPSAEKPDSRQKPDSSPKPAASEKPVTSEKPATAAKPSTSSADKPSGSSTPAPGSSKPETTGGSDKPAVTDGSNKPAPNKAGGKPEATDPGTKPGNPPNHPEKKT